MKRSILRAVYVASLMMALPQISHAQSGLLDVLKNVAKTTLANSDNKTVSTLATVLTGVEGMKSVNDSVVVGTWIYSQPCVTFDTDNPLTDISGTAASSTMESTLKSQLEKLGITSGKLILTLKEDKKGSVTSNDKKTDFTWAVEDSCLSMTIQETKIKMNAQMNGNSLQLSTSAEKLLAMISAFSTKSGTSTASLSSLTSSLNNVQGIFLGLKFDKKTTAVEKAAPADSTAKATPAPADSTAAKATPAPADTTATKKE